MDSIGSVRDPDDTNQHVHDERSNDIWRHGAGNGSVESANAAIVTLEGLSTDGTHPVQQAWQEIDVAQCGYCQAGQIMSAAALIARVSKPTDADIDRAMNGNLCRCGTYLRIRQAVHKAAQLAATTSTSAQGRDEEVR